MRYYLLLIAYLIVGIDSAVVIVKGLRWMQATENQQSRKGELKQ